MLTIPNRLFDLPSVTILYRSPGLVLLHKQLSENQEGRLSLLRMHTFSIVRAGEQLITTEDGRRLTVRPGAIGMIPRGFYTVTDLVTGAGSFESVIVFCSDEVLRRLPGPSLQSSFGGVPQLMSGSMPALAPMWAREVLSGYHTLGSKSDTWIELKVRELFLLLQLEQPDLSEKMASWTMASKMPLLTVMDNFAHHPLSIQDYALLSGRSESAFRREFRSKTGMSPLQWLKLKRLARASDLLSQREAQVADVAAMVGYENVSHFIREFKKQYGHTPGTMVRNSAELSDRFPAS